MTRLRSLAYYAAAQITGATIGTAVILAVDQTPRPGVDCSLLTPTQAAGLVCATPPKSVDWTYVQSYPPTEVAPVCDPRPNPYAEPERAVACVAWDREHGPEPPAWPTFTVGTRYAHAYPHVRMVVVAVGLSLEGVPVVTGQYTAGEQLGQVFAFRVDQAQPWIALGGQ